MSISTQFWDTESFNSKSLQILSRQHKKKKKKKKSDISELFRAKRFLLYHEIRCAAQPALRFHISRHFNGSSVREFIPLCIVLNEQPVC